jgi:hypothetical protein
MALSFLASAVGRSPELVREDVVHDLPHGDLPAPPALGDLQANHVPREVGPAAHLADRLDRRGARPAPLALEPGLPRPQGVAP